MRRILFVLFLTAIVVAGEGPSKREHRDGAIKLELPLKTKSVRFAVIGDTGTGGKAQYELARRMAAYREEFPFEFVIMLGDNIYGSKRDADFKKKFEEPYQPLLDGGVKFYASLGNHDDPNESFYKFFNMDGKRYYNLKKGNAEFFALDSTYMDAKQLDWIKQQLPASNATWKICYFHHPLYSDGRFHGPDTDLRARLEPVLQAGGVSVVFFGHEHVYESLKPQNGIYYFVVGNSGELRPHNLRSSAMMEKGFDTDRTFMLVEIAGDELYFQTVSRAGEVVDSGIIQKAARAAAAASRDH